ncbi:acyltransferase family protein [Nocardioides panzhihuensis]|uniref:Peptidoglycan/LPS O-acetylase OafA/YrhL n=1 Tax=Nocardioides panzhihuensis TaxID=860243 RepID=A0A7Z0IRA0_9ACTN|nr:acyltransferase [Nocardioides panzhihuensis]NYI76595.1 peptidoglycan/LPS O-acetylase OafA/YrhL [Nocardioides panzhihuensis]
MTQVAQTRFEGIDSIRALGAFAVLTTHVAFWAGAYTNGLLGGLLSRLDVGVALFFVLSGFLLGRPWLVRATTDRRAPASGPYLWKRFLRIAPLYVVTVVVALGLLRSNQGTSLRTWLVTLVMGNTYVDTALPPGLTHMWSLAVEVAFYLLLPVIMLVLVGTRRRLAPRRFVLGLAAMAALTFIWVLLAVPVLEERISAMPAQWLPGFLLWFAAGLFLALIQVLREQGLRPAYAGRLVTLARLPGSAWLLAGGLMLVAATPVAGPTTLTSPEPAEVVVKHTLYAVVAFVVVATAVFADPVGLYGRLLGHRFSQWLGRISYGIFCLHMPVLHLVMWVTGWKIFDGHGLQIWAMTVVLSLVVAEVAYRLVELPFARLRDRPPFFLRSRRETAASSVSVTGTRTG